MIITFLNLLQQSQCTLEELQSKLDPMKYVGRSKEQVDEYLANVIKPILDSNKEELGMKAEINV